MNRSGLRRRVPVPSASTVKTSSRDYQFSAGLNTNAVNDEVSVDEWRYITDARETLIGKWETRRGCDLFSVPVGETVNVQQTSTTGASDFSFSSTTWFAKKLVAGSSGRLTAIDANIRNTASGTGTIVLALYTDNSGAPGTEIARTTISASAVTSSYQYVKGRSIRCPDIVSGTTYWVLGFVQTGGINSYQISTTTNATTGQTSTTSGLSWTSQSYDFNIKLSTATANPVKGTIRVKRPGGAHVTFVAINDTLYTVNEATGATTAVDTGLDPAATYVRFEFVADTLYYVQGTTKPRKYDFSTASVVTNAPENAAAILNHKGLIFYASADDPSKFFFTNFGIYDTFTSTDFIYAPSPKTSDPITALTKLMGNLFVITRGGKYILYGAENATFKLDTAIGQKGTFSQESVVFDEDRIFLASDDGIYEFNGSQEINITSPKVLDWWTGLLKRENTVLELHNNRLYCFYTPNGQSVNTACKVYNTTYGIWESDDTNTYVGHTFTREDNDNYFIQGSNRVGMLMLGEQPTNDYNNMGEPLTYELRTSYNPSPGPVRRYTFTTSAEYKRVSKYRPHFDTVSGNYSIQVGYALDYSDSPTYVDVSLSGTGPRFDQGYRFNSGIRYGQPAQVNPGDDSPVIPGSWRRLQIRYKHYAAREPVAFDGHVLSLETQRQT